METPEVSSASESVQDSASAIKFIRWCVARLGLGYHPDTLFSEYVDPEGRNCFSTSEAERLDALQEQVLEYCDPYEVGMGEFGKLAPELGAEHVTETESE